MWSLNRRRKFVFLAVLGLLAVLLLVLWERRGEPSYHGRKLSHWLSLDARRSTGRLSLDELDAAPEAMRHIGTNALPYLAAWIQSTSPPASTVIARVIQALPPSIRDSRLVGHLAWEPSYERIRRASVGYQLLGQLAAPAIPELKSLALSPNPCADPAAEALGSIGPEALRVLCNDLADPGSTNRVQIAEMLPTCRWTDPRPAIPILAHCVTASDPNLVRAAARALRDFRIEPQIALPALCEAFRTQTNQIAREKVAEALASFGPAGGVAVPMLLSALDQRADSPLAQTAARSLGSLRLEPTQAVPALTRALQQDDADLQCAAASALGEFGIWARPALPALMAALENSQWHVRSAATQAVRLIAPEKLPGVQDNGGPFALHYFQSQFRTTN